MKKEQRPPFAKNLTKARKAHSWNQNKAADMLGIPRKTYGAYEEGRAHPSLKILPTIVSVFGITNLLAFIEDVNFSYYDQDKEFTVEYQSPLEKIYANAPERDRKIVDMALGIGVEAVTC